MTLRPRSEPSLETMREQQQRVSVHSPKIWFGAYLTVSIICGIGIVKNPNINVDLALRLEGAALGFIAAVTVMRDKAKHHGDFPTDWMFMLWPVLFPIYLLTEKTWRGALWLLGIVFLLGLSVIAPELLR